MLLPVALLALAAACTTTPTGRSQLMLIPPESAIVQSQTAYLATVKQLDKEGKLSTDPALVSRVEAITERVVGAAVQEFPNTRDWEWSVAVIDDPDTINAWCMAGGRMAVYSGLFEKLNLTNDEFAQIMGHEVSHAIANHTAERMSRAMLTQGGLATFAIVSDIDALQLTGLALAAELALTLPNSRTAESEADQIGMELATLAGFEPGAAVTLWEKMGSAGGSRPPAFLSTHPSPENRQQRLAEMAAQMEMPGTPPPPHPVTMVSDLR
jgi:predicted Zn-dependent protease